MITGKGNGITIRFLNFVPFKGKKNRQIISCYRLPEPENNHHNPKHTSQGSPIQDAQKVLKFEELQPNQ